MLVTGASSAIGAATVRAALQAGTRVVLAARREDRIRTQPAQPRLGDRQANGYWDIRRHCVRVMPSHRQSPSGTLRGPVPQPPSTLSRPQPSASSRLVPGRGRARSPSTSTTQQDHERLRLVPRRLALCDVTSAGCRRDDGRHYHERVEATLYNKPVRDHGEDEPKSEQG